MAISILARLDPKQIVYEPFPHLYVEGCLEPEYYAELSDAFPTMEKVVGKRRLLNNHAYFMGALGAIADPDVPLIWREFFTYHTSADFLKEYLAFWRCAIEDEYPDVEARFGKPLGDLTAGIRHPGRKANPENLKSDVMLDCQFGINSPVTTGSTVRGPHIDYPSKLFNALLYFRDQDDDSMGGELVLHRSKTGRVHQDNSFDIADRLVYPASKVAYRPNTLVMMLNTSRGIHGVAQRQPTKHTRKYVNLLAECYKLSTNGFFPKQRTVAGRAGEAFRRILGSRA